MLAQIAVECAPVADHSSLPNLDSDLLSRWIKPLAAGGWSDLFFEWKTELLLRVSDGEIREATTTIESGTAARARRGDRIVVAASSRADQAGAREAIRTLARELPSAHFPKAVESTPPDFSPEPPDGGRWAKKICALLARVFENHRHEVEIRRRQATRLVLTGDRPGTHSERLRLSLTGKVELNSPGGVRLRRFSLHFPESDDGAMDELRQRLRLLSAPAARPAPPAPGTIDVLFENGSAAFLFHEILSHPLEADAPGSRLAQLMKARLAPREIDVADEPARLDLFGGYAADDEGTPARRTPLLSAGHLSALLRDRFHSDALHPSTANGRRCDPFDQAAPRGSNIVVGAGGASEEEMMHRLGNGVRVEEFEGGSVDPASGSFRLRFSAAQGVSRGRPAQPLAAGMLEGGVLEALSAIDPLVGSRPKACRELGWCARDGRVLPVGGEAPALIVRRLRIAPL
jgi:TldD protein